MDTNRLTFSGIALKTIAVHTVTYFIVGILSFTLLDYGSLFAEPGLSTFMRRIDDPLVMAGPLFQPIRGILFGVVFYLLRDVLFGKDNGWMIMWTVLVFVGIFSTFGPSPGSLEGMVYTMVPIRLHLVGLIEILVQSFLLSAVLSFWVNHPAKRWITWLLAVGFAIVILLPALGLLMR